MQFYDAIFLRDGKFSSIFVKLFCEDGKTVEEFIAIYEKIIIAMSTKL